MTPCLHLVEVVDLFAVADGLDDGVEGLVPLLFGGSDDSLSVFFIVTELENEIKISMVCSIPAKLLSDNLFKIKLI